MKSAFFFFSVSVDRTSIPQIYNCREMLVCRVTSNNKKNNFTLNRIKTMAVDFSYFQTLLLHTIMLLGKNISIGSQLL
jgi:hypothetical protein